MRKTLAIFAAFIMLLGIANMAVATQTRVTTLGKAWMFDGDFEDIYLYPNAVIAYPRMMVGELGTFPADFQYYGSAALTFANEEQTWGVAGFDINHNITGEADFKQYITDLNAAFGGIPMIGDVLPHIDNKYHLFYAKEIGGLSTGLHIARAAAASSYMYTDTTSGNPEYDFENSAGIWDFNFGLGYSPMENMEANLGFSFKTYSFSAEYNETYPGASPAITPISNTVESDGGSGIDVALQVLYGMTDNFKLVPTAGISTRSIGFKTSYSDTANHPEKGSVSSTDIWAGFGGNYTPIENVRILGGIDFGYWTETIEDSFLLGVAGDKEYKTSIFMFPGFSAALEADVLKWLTVRIGASKDIAKVTETDTKMDEETETTYTYADYKFGFGLGFKFNRLNIDVKVNDNAPYSLGYFMSGIDNGGVVPTHTEPITQVSATYKF